MNLDWITALGIFGTLVSVVGLIYAWAVARRSERRKILTYKFSSPLSLARVLPDRIEHRLSIIYEREGAEPINIKGAYLWVITLGNIGREPVRREDIAPSDPLRVVVENAKVLDIAHAGISRAVINFDVAPFEEKGDELADSILSFDFMDYRDAASVRVLTDSAEARISIRGTIIGMPEGVREQDELGTLIKFPFVRRHLEKFAIAAWMILSLSISMTLIVSLRDYLGKVSKLGRAGEIMAVLSIPLIIGFGLLLPIFIVWLYDSRVARKTRLPESLPPPKD